MNKLNNIIFLDIDGVLCTPRACAATDNTGMSSYLDPIGCQLVKRLCEDNNAKIVISSAWRLTYDNIAMRAILNAACPSLGDFILTDEKLWKTQNFVISYDNEGSSERGLEISGWIYNNAATFNNFVILDYLPDMMPLQDSLVQCNYNDGISYMNYIDADKILKQYC